MCVSWLGSAHPPACVEQGAGFTGRLERRLALLRALAPQLSSLGAGDTPSSTLPPFVASHPVSDFQQDYPVPQRQLAACKDLRAGVPAPAVIAAASALTSALQAIPCLGLYRVWASPYTGREHGDWVQFDLRAAVASSQDASHTPNNAVYRRGWVALPGAENSFWRAPVAPRFRPGGVKLSELSFSTVAGTRPRTVTVTGSMDGSRWFPLSSWDVRVEETASVITVPLFATPTLHVQVDLKGCHGSLSRWVAGSAFTCPAYVLCGEFGGSFSCDRLWVS